jgi:hypothetical protein
MKSLKLFFLAALAAVGMQTQAQTVTPGNVGVTGSFVGTCSMSGTAIALGQLELNPLRVSVGTNLAHVRIPVNLGVTCNSDTLPWKMYNTAGPGAGGAPLTIGTTANNACISKVHTVPEGSAVGRTEPFCANATGTLDQAPIAGAGTTATVPVELVIWNGPAFGGVGYGPGKLTPIPFSGTGAIAATIPMKIEY